MFIIHVSNALQSGTDLFHQSHAMHHPEEQRPRSNNDQANNYLVTICYFANYTTRAT